MKIRLGKKVRLPQIGRGRKRCQQIWQEKRWVQIKFCNLINLKKSKQESMTSYSVNFCKHLFCCMLIGKGFDRQVDFIVVQIFRKAFTGNFSFFIFSINDRQNE